MVTLPPPLSMAIAEIDDEHVSIINTVNVLLHEFETQQDSIATLSKLVSMFDRHFKNEVRYMKQLKFPFIDTHKVEHSLLMIKAIALLDNVKNKKATADDAVTFAQDTISHIEFYDVLYAKYASAMLKDVRQLLRIDRKP